MCSVLPEKTKIIETNVRNYLNCSYHLGYDLDNYFTQKQQITMFERLLSCDASFNHEWKSGVYSIPEDPAHTMYLSTYIKKQSLTKKLSRKINKYISNKKLTKGAKNLLEAYMRTQSTIQNKSMDNKMEEIFCGIFTDITNRKKSYITQLTKRVPDDVVKEIELYVPGGTKRKRFSKTKTRKMHR